MKPSSIVQFERLFLGSLAVRALSDAIAFGATLQATKANALTATYGVGAVLATFAIVYLAMAALWYFAARRGSAVAKWLIAAWFVTGACFTAYGVFLLLTGRMSLGLVTVLSWAAFGLLGWATSYLFKPDADAWFAKKPSA
ncbi:hypothetical protein OF829_14830 [Sphingomonas sp. LB-2]|uniref:hypothetical protein n=1 Tax=Sphingomonas caeni TaxID=2984949 RepID=UPI002230DD48|nr:hypothetical protein [Sphingomonas caeni]MCW3848514.1 hypothetical protein [Sphingomonas caeni]